MATCFHWLAGWLEDAPGRMLNVKLAEPLPARTLTALLGVFRLDTETVACSMAWSPADLLLWRVLCRAALIAAAAA